MIVMLLWPWWLRALVRASDKIIHTLPRIEWNEKSTRFRVKIVLENAPHRVAPIHFTREVRLEAVFMLWADIFAFARVSYAIRERIKNWYERKNISYAQVDWMVEEKQEMRRKIKQLINIFLLIINII